MQINNLSIKNFSKIRVTNWLSRIFTQHKNKTNNYFILIKMNKNTVENYIYIYILICKNMTRYFVGICIDINLF